MSRAFLQLAALWAISCVATGAKKGGVYRLRSYEGKIFGSGSVHSPRQRRQSQPRPASTPDEAQCFHDHAR